MPLQEYMNQWQRLFLDNGSQVNPAKSIVQQNLLVLVGRKTAGATESSLPADSGISDLPSLCTNPLMPFVSHDGFIGL
jgi:hypothetical protein